MNAYIRAKKNFNGTEKNFVLMFEKRHVRRIAAALTFQSYTSLDAGVFHIIQFELGETNPLLQPVTLISLHLEYGHRHDVQMKKCIRREK